MNQWSMCGWAKCFLNRDIQFDIRVTSTEQLSLPLIWNQQSRMHSQSVCVCATWTQWANIRNGQEHNQWKLLLKLIQTLPTANELVLQSDIIQFENMYVVRLSLQSYLYFFV